MGDYLRATVSYTDGHGGSKSAQAETVSATPIDGTWSYETVVNPDTIVAGAASRPRSLSGPPSRRTKATSRRCPCRSRTPPHWR